MWAEIPFLVSTRAKHHPARCVVDHNNEETVREVLDRGFWAAFSIYPGTKMGNARMTELVRQFGRPRSTTRHCSRSTRAGSFLQRSPPPGMNSAGATRSMRAA